MGTDHRRICVFIDGTGQDGKHEPNSALHTSIVCFPSLLTNLARNSYPLTSSRAQRVLYNKLSRADPRSPFKPIKQHKLYIPGVGTGEGFIKDAWGVLTGDGLKDRVKEAYRYISERWLPGDEIHLFGFSRGAYAVRLLASLIENLGILDDDYRDRYFDRLFAALDGQTGKENASAAVDRWKELYSKVKRRRDAREAEHRSIRKNSFLINTVLVFDTVDTRGIPPILEPAHPDRLNSFGQPATILETCVQNAYHALSLDNDRIAFFPLLWQQSETPPAGQHLQQVWFAGSHTDVGGGYLEQDLRWITLIWAWTVLEPTLRFDDKFFANLAKKDTVSAEFGCATPNKEEQFYQGSRQPRDVPTERDRLSQQYYHFSVKSRPHPLLHATIRKLGIKELTRRGLFLEPRPLETRMEERWASNSRPRSLSPPYPTEPGEARPRLTRSPVPGSYPEDFSDEQLFPADEPRRRRRRRRRHSPDTASRSRADSSASDSSSVLYSALWDGSPSASRSTSPAPSPPDTSPSATPYSVQTRSRATSSVSQSGGFLAPPMPFRSRPRAGSSPSLSPSPEHSSDERERAYSRTPSDEHDSRSGSGSRDGRRRRVSRREVVCSKAPAQRCSRCHVDRSSYFCSTDCQRLIWPYHKRVCGQDVPYFPFPNFDTPTRIFTKITCTMPTPVCFGATVEEVMRKLLKPPPEQDIDFVIDDFLAGRTKVVLRDPKFDFLAFDEKGDPVFPLLGWLYANVWCIKRYHDDRTYSNPFSFTGYLMHIIVGGTRNQEIPKEDHVPFNELPTRTKHFLDTVFVFASLMDLYQQTPRPSLVTLALLETSMQRVRDAIPSLDYPPSTGHLLQNMENNIFKRYLREVQELS
ncbi:hypothetical protein JCM10207_002865 [Rhodosporidiobolus poonsookiae]